MAIPTLGYPSQTAAALALRDAGLSPREIAAAMNVDTYRVNHLISMACRNGTGDRHANTLQLSPALRRNLGEAATKRRTTPVALANAILTAVADDQLVDAILDDVRG